MESIEIEADDYSLKGKLYGSAHKNNPRPALIFLSGWHSASVSKTTCDIYAERCARKFDIICLTVALRGMGSEGDMNVLTRSDFLDDVLTAYDFMESHEGVDEEGITVVGESFGAYMACLLSAKRPVYDLILRVPTDFPNEGFEDIPQKQVAAVLSRDWNLQEHSPEESFALEAVHGFKNKIFIVASQNDEIVSRQTTENYLNAVPDLEKMEYTLMKNTGHVLVSPLKLRKFIGILFGIVERIVN